MAKNKNSQFIDDEEDNDELEKAFNVVGKRLDGQDSTSQSIKAQLDSIEKQLSEYSKLWKHMLSRGFVHKGNSRDFFSTRKEAAEFGKICRDIGRNRYFGQQEKDMNTISNEDGGFLTSNEFQARLIDLLPKYGALRRNCTVLPMGAELSYLPMITSDMIVYKPGQGVDGTKSSPGMAQISLRAQKLLLLAIFSNELDEECLGALGEILAQSITRSVAKAEDTYGFIGDGTSAYHNFIGAAYKLLMVDATPANIAGAHVTAYYSYSQLALSDFEEVVARLPSDFDDEAKWYCSKAFFYKTMFRIASHMSGANQNIVLTDKRERYFMGYPVEFVSCLPGVAAASQVPCLLADLRSGVYLGERAKLVIDRSDDVLFKSDQSALRGRLRMDINAFGVGNTSDAGPICGMITGTVAAPGS